MKRLLALTVVLALSAFGLISCGDSGITEAELERERADAAQGARQEARIKALEQEVTNQGQARSDSSPSSAPVSPPSHGPIPADARACGSAYGAGSASCPFVENVSGDYYASGQSGSFTSYSPVTGLTYRVTCNGSSPTVCTAGNNAVIYIP